MHPPVFKREAWYAKIGHQPRRWQHHADAAFEAGKRFVAPFAFPQAGKSYWAARHVEADLLHPDCHGWLVAPNYALGAKEFGYIWVDFLNANVLKLATRKAFDPRGGNMTIEFPWGSFVRVISVENPESLRAEQLDFVVLCEASALPSNIYERYLYARVELRQGKVLIPTTPSGFNWVYDAFRIPSLERLDFTYGDWDAAKTRPRLGGTPNPRYDPAYWSAVVSATPDFGDVLELGVHSEEAVQRAQRLLPRPSFVEQFGGDFASYAGLIYHFDPTEHECEPFPVPEWWTHVVGWDHGADMPTAILFGSYDPSGTIYWWDEIYCAGLSAGEYAQRVRGRLAGRSPSTIVIDPSARQVRIELLRVGLATTIPFQKDIEARITKTTALMRERKWKVMRGRCPNLLREIRAWEWDEKNPGKPRPKQSNHALDAAGYAVLAEVPLPQQYAEVEQDTVPGETPFQERVWKPLRRHFREQDEKLETDLLEEALADNPFAEEGLVPQEYVGVPDVV